MENVSCDAHHDHDYLKNIRWEEGEEDDDEGKDEADILNSEKLEIFTTVCKSLSLFWNILQLQMHLHTSWSNSLIKCILLNSEDKYLFDLRALKKMIYWKTDFVR